MLMNNVMCLPLNDKSANTVVNAYSREVYCRFGGSLKILSDNRSEFKNFLFSEVASQLVIKSIYCSPCRPQENKRIEISHKFLKMH